MPEVEGRVTRLLHLSTMMLAITSSPPQLHVFHIPEEKLIGSLDLGAGGDATAILHPATWLNKIILGRESGVVQIWNIRTGKLIYETESFGSAVTCLAQSPALDVIGIGLHSGTIHIRNLRTDTQMQTFSQPQPIHSLTFRTDGPPLLASSSSTGRLSIFDLDKRRVVHTLETSSTNQPVNIIFLPNQPILLTTSRDNSIKLFVFENSGPRLLKSRTGHSAPPTALHTHSAKWLLSSAAGSLRAQSLFNDSQSFEFSQTALMEGYQKQAAGQGYAAANIADVVAIGSSSTRQEEWDAVITASRGERGARSWSWKRRTVGSHLFYTGDMSGVTAAAVSYCGNFGVVGSERGNIEVFNMQSGIKRKRYPPSTKWAYAQVFKRAYQECDICRT
jgi:U3 small nucleolar RNA-associated protein 21